jgi:hypothetical protein
VKFEEDRALKKAHDIVRVAVGDQELETQKKEERQGRGDRLQVQVQMLRLQSKRLLQFKILHYLLGGGRPNGLSRP